MERKALAVESLITGSSGQEALNHAIQAAELYMRAAGEATNKADAARLRRKCQQLIAQAERIKTGIDQDPGAAVIRRSSRLHGNDFPAWASDPTDDEFQLTPGSEPFIDDAAYSLSPAQNEYFDTWTRPKDLFRDQQQEDGGAPDFMTLDPGIDLVQDVTTDCSVVAGLSAAMEILTGKEAILASIFYPFDHAAGKPQLSASGKYVMRMRFNGCDRRVVIDDRLPASKTDRTLFVVDRTNPTVIWPALIEKAYLKIRGGYDFPGSNSSTDLWVLMGWIPEQVFLQREDFDLNKIWSRIKAAYDAHNVVVTLGTGRTSGEEEEFMGLIGEHDYAVQNLDEKDGIRRMLVKNPWCNGPVWRGASWSLAGHLAQPDQPTPTLGASDSMSPGSIWVTLEDVAQNFESMYLNWNPRLFPHRQECHFTWDLPPSYCSSTLVRNPQFTIESPKGGLVWVVVSRHFVDAELDIARNKAGSMADVSCRLGFMSILLFDDGGFRARFSDGAVYRGPYVDSPQTLARFQVARGRRYTVVLDQQEFPLSSYAFTMSLFSTEALQVQPAKDRLPHLKEQLGAWTRRTAGGNASSSTYYSNPQFTLSIPQSTPLSIFLSTDNAEYPVHVDVVWAQGKRVISIRERDLVVSSGAYQRNWALAESPAVGAGTYTIVCSTFEAGQTASFALRVNSMVPLRLEAVPADAAGMLRASLPAVRLSATGEQGRRAAIATARLSRAWVSVRSVNSAGTQSLQQRGRVPSMPMVRITVVRGWGPERVTVTTSGDGEFQEPSTALRTPEFDLEPNHAGKDGTWLILESIGGYENASDLECEVFSDSRVRLGEWERI